MSLADLLTLLLVVAALWLLVGVAATLIVLILVAYLEGGRYR